ncbi:ATP-binding protein [Candidatus Pacearchaeota archaeon]|nr:ATP-binding protein [Candidatus Pacearchaeota archaeon]
MTLDASEQMEKFQDFVEQSYQKELHENVSKGYDFLVLDFFELTKFDPRLADQLLEEPEETLKAAEIALEQFDVRKGFRIRFRNLPKSQEIFIRNLRSKHLSKFIAIEGIIRQSSEVRPQAVSAKFECPSCGNVITMPQIDQQFREPTRCTCGRKGKFRLLSKTLVDVQRLVIEESPENLEGGAQPKRMQVFLREDLVEPRMEKRTTPGTRILVSGMMYEVPIPTRTGGVSTRFDLAMTANYVDPIEEDYSEIIISPEDEKEIRVLARDKKIYERLIASISPSIFGHDRIKEAIMLQLFGGIRKTKKDGTIIRGDLHVLLVGDPGCGKTLFGNSNIFLNDGSIFKIKDYIELNSQKWENHDDCKYQFIKGKRIPSLGHHGKNFESKIKVLWKKPMESLKKITTSTGREIICTLTNPMFVCKDGKVNALKTKELEVGNYLACPRIVDIEGRRQKLNFKFNESKRGKKIIFPKETSNEFWRVLGYLVSEGYCAYANLRFTNSSKILLNDYNNCIKNLFGFEPGKYFYGDCWDYIVSYVNFSKFLYAIDSNIFKLSGEKRVPKLLFKCTKEEIRNFLRAYYDGDAHVNDRSIEVSSKSKKLLEEIRILLLRFGIQSQLHLKIGSATNTKKKLKRRYYRLSISGEDIEKYYREISFLSPEKKISLEKILDKIRNTNIDIVPNISKILKRVRNKLRMTQFDLDIPRSSYQHYERGDRNPSRDALQRIVNAFALRIAILDYAKNQEMFRVSNLRNVLSVSQEGLSKSVNCSQSLVGLYERDVLKSDEKMQIFVGALKEEINLIFNDLSIFEDLQNLCKLAYSDIFWDKIVTIEDYYSNEKWLYDIEVEETHNFIANGFYVHNSQMLTFVNKAAPKARYVAGRSASGAGLTASVVKDEFLRGWALEAGAMVLADKGVLVLDEMDKISSEDTSALHEAMEQQHISIAKANIQACYSEDTEVLTNEGWKKYYEVKNKKIAQYDPKSRTIQLLPHKGLFVYEYKNKEMYHFKNQRNDILVTPNHKMLFKEIRHKNYQYSEAEKISYSRVNFLNSGEFVGLETRFFNLPSIKHKQNRKHTKYTHQEIVKKIPMDLWLEFLGYYVTEGGLQNKYSFGIPQKDKSNVKLIRKCLVKLSKYVGFSLSETKEGVYTRFQITNAQLFSYLEKNCGKTCIEKKLPIDLSTFSKRQLKILYNSMMLGDGSSDGRSYSSSSIELINIFQAIACLIGKSASLHVQYEEGSRGNRVTLYRVSLSNKIEPSIKMSLVKKVKYRGKVYCFATKTGFFLTRRNGKIAVQGNTLRTQTSILAAANPKMGRFDPFTPVPNQIDMPPALINRFDLIFVMRDLPNKELDTNIATRVLESHSYQEPAPDIDAKLLRKYLAFTRQKCFPKLTVEAIEEIKNFYVDLRSTGSDGDNAIKPIPISPRQLEAIVRLSEASAKIKLKDKVEREDALRAIALLKGCMAEIGVDPETGKVDMDRITTGLTASTRGRILEVRNTIFELCDEKDGPISVEEDLKPKVFDKGVTEQKLEEAIEKLKRSGDIFEPKKGWLQKI